MAQLQLRSTDRDIEALALSSSSSVATPLRGNLPNNTHSHDDPAESDDNDEEEEQQQQRRPLLGSKNDATAVDGVRVRKKSVKRRRREHDSRGQPPSRGRRSLLRSCLLWCCRNDSRSVQTTVACMNCTVRLVFWGTIAVLLGLVFWYSYELHNKGMEGFTIARYSAGAFVLLGFPISMWGIISHLANYNQPRVQVFIVRILWMVPIYSIQSWLAIHYHKKAIYIETARDFYESYVLYSFLQFLIEVLGGEEALVLMLKDKSPTRGFHMWGFQWCLKPWLMGQPMRKTVYDRTSQHGSTQRGIRKVQWKSPFFIKCKFGVLQYVLLKFVSAIFVLVLERFDRYHEGNFSWRYGYLYVCIVTNVSQCWALYCMIFFYYATKNELAPIRPVGKFLSVKALVFFTWWQSVVIAILDNWNLIPTQLISAEQEFTSEAVAKGIQDYLICLEMLIAAIVHSFVFPHDEYSPQAVEARSRALNHSNPGSERSASGFGKKRLGRSKFHPQPYTAYSYWGGTNDKDDISKTSAFQTNSGNGSGFEMMSLDSGPLDNSDAWDDPLSLQPVLPQKEGYGSPSREHIDLLGNPQLSSSYDEGPLETVMDDEDDIEETMVVDPSPLQDYSLSGREFSSGRDISEDYSNTEFTYSNDDDAAPTKTGFVRALIDSAIPRDLGDNTLGLVKGDYTVEKKTLLHHAATSDQYDLFSPNRRKLSRLHET